MAALEVPGPGGGILHGRGFCYNIVSLVGVGFDSASLSGMMRRFRNLWTCLVGVLCAAGAMGQAFPPDFFSDERVAAGEQLARTVCATCHLQPQPDVLDQRSWLEGAMPWMMMISGLEPRMIPPGIEGHLMKQSGAIMHEPVIAKADFGKVLAYYLKNAPAKLEIPPSVIQEELPGFRSRLLDYQQAEPAALMIDVRPGQLMVADGGGGKLDFLDPAGAITSSLNLGEPVVAMTQRGEDLWLTSVGSFSPSEQHRGKLLKVGRDAARVKEPLEVLKDLPRPVHAVFADLNDDGREDVVMSMFGWYSGRFSWFEHTQAGGYEEHVLFEKPGALRAEVRDMNGDGRLDIVVLVAQATEALFVYVNQGEGEFTQESILQQHPAFGHTWFTLLDFNRDGWIDLITTAGDNGDFPSPPKPYHGIRIYLGQGNLKFEEAWFFPLPGAYRAELEDFDADGDVDIAAVSYYPDFSTNPTGGFVYLENRGKLVFEPMTFPEAAAGRWITMGSGDLDGDGDLDLVLGAVAKGPGKETYVPRYLTERWRQSGTTLMFLENLLVSPK